jgi:hypothetical protein
MKEEGDQTLNDGSGNEDDFWQYDVYDATCIARNDLRYSLSINSNSTTDEIDRLNVIPSITVFSASTGLQPRTKYFMAKPADI